MKGFHLRSRILAPLIFVMVLVISACGFAIYQQEERHLGSELEHQLAEARSLYFAEIASQSEKLKVTLDVIARDRIFRQAMEERDRERLLEHARPVYEHLQRDYQITHFYFDDPNRVNILRVHQPGRFGDLIERFTAKNAELSQETAVGIELGTLGTFTLHAMKPVFNGTKLIGYIELGEEIDPILQRLRHSLNQELMVVIDKQYLRKEDWERGMAMLGRQIEWDRFPELAVVSQTFRTLPSGLNSFLRETVGSLQSAKIEFQIGERPYRARMLPIEDAQSRLIAGVLVASDMAEHANTLHQLIIRIGVLVLILAAFLVVPFYIVLGNTEKHLNKLFDNLRQKRQHLISAQRLAHLGNWSWDRNLKVQDASHEAKRILGLVSVTPSMASPRVLDSIHPDDRDEFLGFVEKIRSLDSAQELIHRIVRPNGQVCTVRNWTEPTFGEDGAIAGFQSSIQDVTEQVQAKKRAAQLGQILKHSWNEIYTFDAETLSFIDLSDGLRQNLGYSKNEMAGMRPMDIMPDLSQEQLEVMMQPLRTGKLRQYGFEAEHRRGDGSRYPVEVSLQYASLGKAGTYIAIVQDISSRRHYIDQLKHKTLHDQLTGLPNRSLLLDHLYHSMEEAKRESEPLSVLMVKALRLREINDLLGHANGDEILKETARCLHTVIRKSDTLARMGSNEFAIVLHGATLEQAQVVARKIQQQFENPVVTGDIQVEIETTIGIAIYPDHSDNPQGLLQYADIAMQVAKNEPYGISVYNAGNDPYSKRRLQLHGELRKAIKDSSLTLYYQPKIDIVTRKIVGVEALARWPHPTEGMIPPNDFIPLIEQSGLIRPFTLWALETAIVQAAQWQQDGHRLSVSVNLSTRNLVDPDLPDMIHQQIERHELDPALLTLEITESAIMYRPEFAMEALNKLNAMGVKLSIDDFGTGYSSLSYLRRLPVHELKIDRSFVANIYENDSDAMIVSSTIELAHNLGMSVVAEGIEEAETLDLLGSFRCDFAQGYYISRPTPAEELADLLNASSAALRDNRTG
ncbi:MAG: EAL domain-containing protein [Gammaproteobacteria bacterium]|nr:EAL domain-containing protein [Gammaproteobacteria bacterium]